MKQLSILILLFFLNCGPDQSERDEYNYTVKNESGVPLKVKSYNLTYTNVGPYITNFDINQTITRSFKDTQPPHGYNFGSFFMNNDNNYRNDSLVVIYNNKKITSFKRECNDNKSNPLNSCKYNSLNETFIFTKEDYENATDCNGDCE